MAMEGPLAPWAITQHTQSTLPRGIHLSRQHIAISLPANDAERHRIGQLIGIIKNNRGLRNRPDECHPRAGAHV
jgi:hypothetical protein